MIFSILPVIAIGLAVFAACVAFGIADYLTNQNSMGSLATDVMPLLIGILIISTPIFLGLRLSFVFPLAVLEGGLRIFRAWRLACQNSWRLPFVIILGWGACLAPIVAALIALSPTGLPESGNTREALLYFEEELGNLLIVTIADWLGSVIITAVGAGLLCYAFKAVVDSRNDIIEGDGVPAAE